MAGEVVTYVPGLSVGQALEYVVWAKDLLYALDPTSLGVAALSYGVEAAAENERFLRREAAVVAATLEHYLGEYEWTLITALRAAAVAPPVHMPTLVDQAHETGRVWQAMYLHEKREET